MLRRTAIPIHQAVEICVIILECGWIVFVATEAHADVPTCGDISHQTPLTFITCAVRRATLPALHWGRVVCRRAAPNWMIVSVCCLVAPLRGHHKAGLFELLLLSDRRGPQIHSLACMEPDNFIANFKRLDRHWTSVFTANALSCFLDCWQLPEQCSSSGTTVTSFEQK